jgi:hypothetical protein
VSVVNDERYHTCWHPGCTRGRKDGFDVWVATHHPSGRAFVVLSTGGHDGLKWVLHQHLRMPDSVSPFGRLVRELGDGEGFEGMGFALVGHAHGGSSVQERQRERHAQRLEAR